jgi:hypothetical protein
MEGDRQEKKKGALVAQNEATCLDTFLKGRATSREHALRHGISFGSDKRAAKLTEVMVGSTPKGWRKTQGKPASPSTVIGRTRSADTGRAGFGFADRLRACSDNRQRA